MNKLINNLVINNEYIIEYYFRISDNVVVSLTNNNKHAKINYAIDNKHKGKFIKLYF